MAPLTPNAVGRRKLRDRFICTPAAPRMVLRTGPSDANFCALPRPLGQVQLGRDLFRPDACPGIYRPGVVAAGHEVGADPILAALGDESNAGPRQAPVR